MSDQRENTYPGQPILRFEIPAVIVVNAADADEAELAALAIGPQLDAGVIVDGPAKGATVAVVGQAKACEQLENEDDRRHESPAEHAESLQHAAGWA